jgi:hypothetical protein
MIDLFHPPKPHELLNRKPDFVHIIRDDPEEPIVVWDGACRVCGRTEVKYYAGHSKRCMECTRTYQGELYRKRHGA